MSEYLLSFTAVSRRYHALLTIRTSQAPAIRSAPHAEAKHTSRRQQAKPDGDGGLAAGSRGGLQLQCIADLGVARPVAALDGGPEVLLHRRGHAHHPRRAAAADAARFLPRRGVAL